MTAFWKKMVLILTMASALLAAVATQAADISEESGLQMHWRSNNMNPEQLAIALERLYVVLYNTKNLPIREFEDPEGRPLEAILRLQGLFFGSYFPEGVEAVVCDINPRLCDRPRYKVPRKQLESVTKHVGGYRKSRGRWSNRRGSKLILPDLSFQPYLVLTQLPYGPDDSIQAMVEAQDADCSDWNMSCLKLVRLLNPALVDPKRSAANKPSVVAMAVKGVESDLVFAGTQGSQVEKILATLGEPPKKEVLLPVKRELHFAEEWKVKIRKTVPADAGIKALSRQILSSGSASVQSFHDSHFSEQMSLLKLIHHPFAEIDDIPQSYKQPIPVAVLDAWLDTEHCELKNKLTILSASSQLGTNRPLADKCGMLMNMAPNLADDHGTHVTGLIGSAPNDDGVVGLNPYASLKYINVDMVSLTEPNYRKDLATSLLLHAIQGDGIKVANISWRYSNQVGDDDPIRNNIRGLEQKTLFIVAAGNSGQSLDQACGALPACFSDYKNVVTVVGLDRDLDTPHLWSEDGKGSNYSRKFNVGAIAKDVISTTYRNYTGRLSGTSQAAPQVTAAASLLYSVFETHHKVDQPELLPSRVKNRLIYTSDLHNAILDKMQGGRLNVERVLDTARDYVVIRKNSERKVLSGTLTRFGNNPPDEYITCRLRTNKIEDIKRVDLRRMFYDENRRKYVIFRNSESNNRDSPLERIDDCRLVTRSHIAAIETDDGDEVEFEFRDIRDYISLMF